MLSPELKEGRRFNRGLSVPLLSHLRSLDLCCSASTMALFTLLLAVGFGALACAPNSKSPDVSRFPSHLLPSDASDPNSLWLPSPWWLLICLRRTATFLAIEHKCVIDATNNPEYGVHEIYGPGRDYV